MTFGTQGMSFGDPATMVLNASVGCCEPPRKKKRVLEESSLKQQLSGRQGYVYDVEYRAGYVKLCVNSSIDGDDQTVCMSLSVKDWRLFYSEVCVALSQPSYPDSIYVAQWISASSPLMYRIETDRFNKHSDGFIFFRVCDDLDGMIAARGRRDWLLQPYPVTVEESDNWFKNVFFIQWGDWRALQKLFNDIDKTIQKDKVVKAFEDVRKRLFHPDNRHAGSLGVSAGNIQYLSVPTIFRHEQH